MNAKTPIPGNKATTFGRIYSDTTREALESHLSKVLGGQQANLRSNPKYRAEVSRLRRAIAAR